jgi:hypothetical protein
MFSGKVHAADLPVTQEQLDRFAAGENVGIVFPNIPPEWREFIMTGTTPAEWAKEFGKARTGQYDGPEIEPVTIVEVRA